MRKNGWLLGLCISVAAGLLVSYCVHDFNAFAGISIIGALITRIITL